MITAPENHSWIIDNVKIGAKLDIVKFDDVNEISECVSPLSDDPNVIYTIGISSKYRDQTNLLIVDQLPRGVDFISADPADPNFGYDLLTHTYTWYLPSLEGYDPPSDANLPFDPNTYFYLYTRVNTMAEPESEIVNKVTVDSDQWSGAYAEAKTPICCWGPDVIYVDRNAPGYVQIGTSWDFAYQDLNDALARAKKGCKNIIHVADGAYHPSNEFSENPTSDSFEIPAGVSVYGGYAGWGATNPDKCDPNRFPTILSGYVDESINNETVVTMGNNSLLDGMTVEEGSRRAIFGKEADFKVDSCIVKNNTQIGIYCENGDLLVRWCDIKNNGYQGIHHLGGSNDILTIENSKISNNQRDGIRTDSTTSYIKNSSIYKNGSGGSYYGINVLYPPSNPTIRNCTIVHNANEGIRRLGGSLPDIWNCILYYNNDDEAQIEGMNLEDIYYCCVPDCNEVNSQHNIEDQPDFVYNKPPYGFYHIKYDSPCRETGDPDEEYYVGIHETDMDDEDRIQEYEIDIGADEVSCTDTYDPNDWTYDGVINYEDFAILSHAWLSCDPNVYGYDPDYEYIWYTMRWGFQADMNKDSCVDILDLIEFCDPNNWLWEACWRESYIDVYCMMNGGGGESAMMAVTVMESIESTPIQMTSVTDPETMEQNILLIIEEIEKYMEEAPENYEALIEMKVFLEDVLSDLKNDEI